MNFQKKFNALIESFQAQRKKDEHDMSIIKDTPEREHRKDSNVSASSSVSSMSDTLHRRTSSIGMLSDTDLTSTPKSEAEETVSSPDM